VEVSDMHVDTRAKTAGSAARSLNILGANPITVRASHGHAIRGSCNWASGSSKPKSASYLVHVLVICAAVILAVPACASSGYRSATPTSTASPAPISGNWTQEREVLQFCLLVTIQADYE
jgi:hypothetical protein